MKNIVAITLLFLHSVLLAAESLECNFAGKYLNISDFESVSHISDTTVAIKKGDSVYVAKIDDVNNLSDLKYDEMLSNLKAEGQIAYNGKDTYYYTQNGKMMETKVKKGEIVSTTLLEIPGTVVKREEYEHGGFVYASWHYKPEDNIKLSNPALSKNGKTIYFSANIEGSKGKDIYSAQKRGNSFSKPQRLGKNINSDADEDNPYIRKDGRMTFSSNRKNDTVNVADGMHHVYIGKPNGGEKTRLFQDFATANEEISANIDNTADSINAQKEENQKVLDALAFNLNNAKLPLSRKVLDQIFELNPDTMVMASKHVVAGINKMIFYFDYDSDVVDGEYKDDIKVILDFINLNPESQYSLIGHTDERGAEDYNQALSIRRAKQIENALVKNKINRKQLVLSGEGETRPVVKNAQTEDEHQKNRRVEIILID
ncbi:MAG: OmpA family protein [Bacteroidales bacterium]|nr:OmpA family protein [Candidatus Scybalocola fimicaballi]